jgi:hypothetical protein
MKRRIAILFALAALGAAAPAQGSAQGPAQAGAPTQVQAGSQPGSPGDSAAMKGPEKEENLLSRLEIVSLGSFPIMLFYTGFVFDLGRLVANNFDSQYAPWPFQGAYSAPITDSERLTRLGAALGASLVVGGVDLYIHSAKLKKARRLHEAAAEALSPPVPEPAQAGPAPPP